MLARIRAARENESGFTLIELLIVIVILGVLSGIVVFSVSGITNRGNKAACKATSEDGSGGRRGVLRKERRLRHRHRRPHGCLQYPATLRR